MESPVVTIEDRIETTDEFKDYFDAFIPFEERIKRTVWKKITREGTRDRKVLVNWAMREFDISKRTANSVVLEVKGHFNAIRELTREQIRERKHKLKAIGKRIKSDKNRLNKLDEILTKRPLTKEEHQEFKAIKSRLYQRQNRLNRLNQKVKELERRFKTGRFKMCFGTRKLFKAQYYLGENGFNTHCQWLKAFRASRDKNVFYVGSKDETGANQQFQVVYDSETDSFNFKIRKEYPFMKDEKDRYLILKGIHFNHLRDYFKKAAIEAGLGKGDIPITYRIKKRGRKYYLQAIFRLGGAQEASQPETRARVGLDLNSGFIALAEINDDGNLVGTERLAITGASSGQREDSMLKIVKKISLEAKAKGKGIAGERLNFTTTKAKMVRACSKRGKEYNKMLSSLEYRRFREALVSRCYKDGVDLVFVNPKDTTKIGKQKYAKQRSLNSHTAAALVIARRGSGFKDKLEKQ